jgi:UDP-glucuronate decarboxylase
MTAFLHHQVPEVVCAQRLRRPPGRRLTGTESIHAGAMAQAENTSATMTRSQTMKRVLVTGGSGFLGSHLCERLLEREAEVLSVDNYFTGRKQNIAHLLANPHFEALRHDVTFPLYVEVDEIYNLACPASPVHYQFDPVQTTKTSVHGAINMLGLAKRLKARILQASTSEVYGDPQQHPQWEGYWGHVNPVGTRSCYDEGKRCAETLFFDYYRQHGVRIRVARIFNTYGPRMHPDDGRVVSNLIVQALENKPITIYGDGSQTRSFCYVDDLIEALIRFMEAPDQLVGPLNLGNPTETSILELAEMILALTGSRSSLKYEGLPSDDPGRRCPDISRAKEQLGWMPQVDLREGLTRTIEYFREVLRTGRRPARAVETVVRPEQIVVARLVGTETRVETRPRRKERENGSACPRSGAGGFDGRL